MPPRETGAVFLIGRNQSCTSEKALHRHRDTLANKLPLSYAGTNRQLYRDYMGNKRTLPQQMAAMGYNGGLSESAQLRLRNSYVSGASCCGGYEGYCKSRFGERDTE